MIDPEEIPRRLRMSRVGANFTKIDAATHIGVNERTVSNWENGTTQITLASALALCDLYKVNIGELVGDTEFQAAMIEIGKSTRILQEMKESLERIETRRQ